MGHNREVYFKWLGFWLWKIGDWLLLSNVELGLEIKKIICYLTDGALEHSGDLQICG